MSSDQTLLTRLQELFDAPVRIVARPGGRDRRTVICRIGNDLVAVATRKSTARAALEAEVLRCLAPAGLSPTLILQDGEVVVQEYVPGPRHSECLETGDGEALMAQAAATLLEAQDVADAAGLSRRVPAIGLRPGWEKDLADAPSELARAVGLDCPPYDFGDLLRVSPGERRRFVKWDARPGNAICREDGRLCWIDWEHAGARRAVDDLIWLFADEWAPDAPDAQAEALDRLTHSQGGTSAALTQAFLAGAVAHSAIRLRLILARKGEGPWWDRAACLKNDRVGVTPAHVRRVARRAAQWASATSGLRALTSFLGTVESHLS